MIVRQDNEKHSKSQQGFKDKLSQTKELTKKMNIATEFLMDEKMNMQNGKKM